MLVFYEVNCGGDDLLAALTNAGVAFSARHEEGCDYYGIDLRRLRRRPGESRVAPRRSHDSGRRRYPRTCRRREIDTLRRWRTTEDRVRALLAAAAATSTV